MEFFDRDMTLSPYSDGVFYSKNTKINPFIVKAVTNLTPGIAIDFGCGIGSNSKFLKERGWDVYAIDKESIAIEGVSKILSLSNIYKADIVNMDYSILPKSNLIICNYILQHLSIEEAKTSIINMAKLLVKGGFIIFSIFSRKDCIKFDQINEAMKSQNCLLKEKKIWIRKDIAHGPVHLHNGIEGLWIKN